MSKIICDICGTTYPDTAEQCPICGCPRDAALDLLGDDLLLDSAEDSSRGKGGRFTPKKKKEIFDFDEVNGGGSKDIPDEEENPFDEDEEYTEDTKPNTFVVVLLTVLIAVLLLAAGFLFVRYFLPNLTAKETEPPTVPQIVETENTTQELTIPCEGMTMTSARIAELSQAGGRFLIHVTTVPQDTTDQLLFTSADESVATVTSDGRIEAVGEGETVVSVTCGKQVIDVDVVVKFVEETVPPTVAETQPETVAGAEETVEGDQNAATATTAANTGLKDVKLKLKQTDFRLGVYYEHQLLLDCGLEQNEVEWSSEHPYIATVDENGVVKAIKSGTTSITAKYGDQEVQCIVRCF